MVLKFPNRKLERYLNTALKLWLAWREERSAIRSVKTRDGADRLSPLI
jgi:hypothetical protein